MMLDAELELQLPLEGVSPTVDGASWETFHLDPSTSTITRRVVRRSGGETESRIHLIGSGHLSSDLGAEFDLAWLRAQAWPTREGISRPHVLRTADLFSGCGGLSLGLSEACRALGMDAKFVFACDMNAIALDVYEQNLRPSVASSSPLETIIEGDLGSPPTSAEKSLISAIGDVDFVIAGPPCQGHSDLNNHTRRHDPKNELVVRVARFVELFRPRHVVIENVQGIRHDRMGSLTTARRALRQLGYAITEAVVCADQVGVAQSRKRFFLVAGLGHVHGLDMLMRRTVASPRALSWAVGDLLDVESPAIFESPAAHSAENRRRIDYLFDMDLYELPNAERPPCHRDKPHSYHAVYGRMHWHRPAPTITTGFGSTGQGRFVHPLRRRTLTPHEAARVQFFPDFFTFGDRGRRQYQELIGNAVPSKLAYEIALHQLR